MDKDSDAELRRKLLIPDTGFVRGLRWVRRETPEGMQLVLQQQRQDVRTRESRWEDVPVLEDGGNDANN